MCSKSTAHCFLFFAMLLSVIAFALMAVCFATDQWIEIRVDRENLANPITDFWGYSRQYGLFRSCITDRAFSISGDSVVSFYKVGSFNCFNIDYKFESNATVGFSTKEWRHLNFMRVTAGFIILCFFFQVLIVIVSCTGFCLRKSILIHAAAILSLLSGVFIIMAMGFFHGYVHLETQQLSSEPFYPNLWSEDVNSASSMLYGYSYALGWTAAILCIIDAVIFGFSAYYLANRGRWDLFSSDSSSLAKYQAGADFYNYPHPETGYYANRAFYPASEPIGTVMAGGSIPRAKLSSVDYFQEAPVASGYRTLPRQQMAPLDYNTMAFYTPRSLRGPPVNDPYVDFYDPQRTFHKY